MKEYDIDNVKAQMRKGILELCVLKLLRRGEAYPSDIIRSLKEADLIVVEGTIYTLLNRLRREGKLDYLWRESPKGPPRKYFYLTPFGFTTLDAMNEAWNEISRTVNYFSTPNKSFNNDEEDT